jgi:hypothetical protein
MGSDPIFPPEFPIPYPVPGTLELASAQVGTIRLKLLKIGGRIVRSVRRVVLHLATPFPLQDLFRTILARLTQRRYATTLGP